MAPADVVMDRAFTVAGSPDTVWPWLVQLGKQRAGWYLPGGVERLLPPDRRAARTIERRWQKLAVGGQQTRVLFRPRLGPVRRVWLTNTAGEMIDLLTIAGMAAGLRERVAPHR
ncbi:MAG: hypothetical protein ACR2KG_02495 [Nocardioidaceae bacterium]